ncbi:hypothetical protein RB195_012167 [Necator americanus]|uniref:Uncharacterized protein n=1 Tax=Necator americanus TaxID=51031 RepID=A0ABR1D5U4_NECAM
MRMEGVPLEFRKRSHPSDLEDNILESILERNPRPNNEKVSREAQDVTINYFCLLIINARPHGSERSFESTSPPPPPPPPPPPQEPASCSVSEFSMDCS